MAGISTYLCLLSSIVVANAGVILQCDSYATCYEDIIHTVNRAHLFHDSKTFVDMHLKHSPRATHRDFHELTLNYGTSPPKEEVRKFVNTHFDAPGYEFENWQPDDWTPAPATFNNISDPELRKFALELHAIWKSLGRKIKPNVKARNEMYSMIYVNKPVIIPGGRFREFYYWDQYWILKGLLQSEMFETAKGTIENFLQKVEALGYVPNGGRKYYRRSQPPLLIPMVKDIAKYTQNSTFIEVNLPTLEKEFNFWMNKRLYKLSINGIVHDVIRYNVEEGHPRPEAYNADYELAADLPTEEAKHELYNHIKTAAESGLDFSSRWFVPKNFSTVGTLKDCKARFVIPVDLNVLICQNADHLSHFFAKINNKEKEAHYKAIALKWEDMINAVFWNETEGFWFDYIDHEYHRGHKTEFYPGNILPLKLAKPSMSAKIENVLAYLNRIGVLNYEGGIPSSLRNTGQQWDFPNGWAPHVHWFIESLEASGNGDASKIAKETAQKWITNNYVTFRLKNNTMFEKYNVEKVGHEGGGGEYDIVTGFGWSNGAVLHHLVKYGKILKAPGQSVIIEAERK